MSRLLTRMFHIARLLETILETRGQIVFHSEVKRYGSLILKDCADREDEANERLVEFVTSLLLTMVRTDRTRVMKRVVEFVEAIKQTQSPDEKISLLLSTVEEALCLNGDNGNVLAQHVICHLKGCSLDELRQMTAQSLADEFQYSNSYFPKKFMEEQGYSVHDAIIYEKVNRAFQLLSNAEEDWSVKEVSWKLGFSDRRYFSRLFQERYGMRPSEVKRLKDDQDRVERNGHGNGNR